MTKTLTQKLTNLVLVTLSATGVILVSEQIISQEQLTSIQGIVGMALSGGGFTAMTVIYAITTLLPKKTAENFVNEVGVDKINKTFDTVDELVVGYNELKVAFNKVVERLDLELQAKIELGGYEDLKETNPDLYNQLIG